MNGKYDNAMNRLLKNIYFTKNETKVILFLIIVLLAGFSVKYYKMVAGNKSVSFDFTKSDEEFKSKSNLAYNKKFSPDRINNNSEESLSEMLLSPEDSLKTGNGFSQQDIGQKSININTAGKGELVEIPGVGEATAEKIIFYRESKKGFKKIEEIMNVKGIGKKKFEKMKNYIKTE